MSPLLSARALNVAVLPHGDAVSVNPQPLPPREFFGSRTHGGDAVALNPQPLPPRWIGDSIHAALRDLVSLNPQPLPPQERSAYFDDCGTVVPGWVPKPGPRPEPFGEG